MTALRFPSRPAGGVLALDLARKTGFSYAVPDGEPAGGTWVLPSLQTPGEQAVAFEHALSQAVDAFRPAWLVIEAGIMVHGQQATGNMKTAFGLGSSAAATAFRRQLRFREFTPQEARLRVLGDGRPPNPKQVVMRWCQECGFPFWDDNHADSILVGEAALLEVFKRGASPPNGPWNRRRFWRDELV